MPSAITAHPRHLSLMIDFSPMLAYACEALPEQRYLKARRKNGHTVAFSIANMLYEVRWCAAALAGKRFEMQLTGPYPQKGLGKLMEKECGRLELLLKKFRTEKQLRTWLPLPDAEFDGKIALRADIVLLTALMRYQIWHHDLQGAFYTFDRDSAILFAGGNRSALKTYQQSAMQKLMPIE